MIPMMWKFPTKRWFRLGGVEYERGMGLMVYVFFENQGVDVQIHIIVDMV